jgi:hypothetical protein
MCSPFTSISTQLGAAPVCADAAQGAADDTHSMARAVHAIECFVSRMIVTDLQ